MASDSADAALRAVFDVAEFVKMPKLPPVVFGDPIIDAVNRRQWRLPVPQHSGEIQHLQRRVVEVERQRDRQKVRG
jgi:hypothetical protein